MSGVLTPDNKPAQNGAQVLIPVNGGGYVPGTQTGGGAVPNSR